MNKNSIGILLSTLFSSCSPCDYEKLSKLPDEASVPAQYRDDVTFIKDVRRFGIEQLGLSECSPQYTTFTSDQGEARTLYRLFVSKPTVLPVSWWEYGLHFNLNTIFREDIEAKYFTSYEDTLEDELNYYKGEGYDVFYRPTSNYAGSAEGSSLTPSFFKAGKAWQAYVTEHEMCHDTIKKIVHGNLVPQIDEAFCVVFGYFGTVEYFRLKNGAGSEEYKAALQQFSNHIRYSDNLNNFYNRLLELYQSQKPHDEIMEARQEIFAEAKAVMNMEVNNAVLWDNYPYNHNSSIMMKLYESQGKNLQLMLEQMKDCPLDEFGALEYINSVIEHQPKENFPVPF